MSENSLQNALLKQNLQRHPQKVLHLALLAKLITFISIYRLQVQDVMDGDLDDFISAYLRTSVDGRKSKVDQNLVDDD